MRVPVVWSEDCLRHEPGGEVWLGVREEGTEVPARAVVLRDALAAAGAPVVLLPAARRQIVQPSTTRRWSITWLGSGTGKRRGCRRVRLHRVVPYVSPDQGMLAGLPGQPPPAVCTGGLGCLLRHHDAGRGPGSWAAIRGAGRRADRRGPVSWGAPGLCACLPPGHHVTRSAYGGSCYLNNAAIAAQALRAAGARRVAVVDIDAHHGNGTQMIFYERPDVWYGSLHVDPGAGWFPHYAGYAAERGSGDGEGHADPRDRR